MRILITGAQGQLGTELKRALLLMKTPYGELPEVFSGVAVDAVDRSELDIADAESVGQWFVAHAPYDVVFNAAAQTNVDGCEKAEAQAYRVNAQGADNLAKAVNRTGGKLVHVSTDYVFSGQQQTPYLETDAVCPVSAYGRSKLAGEKLALDSCSHTFVVRTAWLYGAQGKNFVKTMLRLGREKGVIRVVNDQFGCPTSATDLADALLRLSLTEQYGIYHGVNSGTCSWFDFACRIVDKAGVTCEKICITTEEYKAMFPMAAGRPKFSSLNNEKLTLAVGHGMRSWQAAIDDFLATNVL